MRFSHQRLSAAVFAPLPFGHELMVYLHSDGWTEAMLLHPWPDRSLEARVSTTRRGSGMLLRWSGAWNGAGASYLYSIGVNSGSGDIPLTSPNGRPDYDGTIGWPSQWVAPTDPNWFQVSGYRVDFPRTILVVACSVIWVPWLLWVVHNQGRNKRRRWRSEHGLCAECGYDMRATPGRCPECGAAVASKSVSETRGGVGGTPSSTLPRGAGGRGMT
jgi:hypothetical protein